MKLYDTLNNNVMLKNTITPNFLSEWKDISYRGCVCEQCISLWRCFAQSSSLHPQGKAAEKEQKAIVDYFKNQLYFSVPFA